MEFGNRKALLWVSLACLYALPHAYDNTLLVGAGFALVLILSSRPLSAALRGAYALYLAISVATYHLLFENQPWEALFGWLPNGVQGVGWPVILCSVIMAYAGWLLIAPSDRQRYLTVTLSIQIPLALLFKLDGVEYLFDLAARALRYSGEHTDGYKAWQFAWMVTYYLPVVRWPVARSSPT